MAGIKEHDFKTALAQIKDATKNIPSDLEFDKYQTSAGPFGLMDYRVKGDDLNDFVGKVQDQVIVLTERDKYIIGELENVYKAFEALDRDYIQAILISIKSAEEASKQAKDASEEAKKALRETDKIVKALQKTTEKLKKFNDRVKTYSHLPDVDKMWKEINDLSHAVTCLDQSAGQRNAVINEQIKKIKDDQIAINQRTEKIAEMVDVLKRDRDELVEFESRLNEIHHLTDVDSMWDDIHDNKRLLDGISRHNEKYDSKVADFEQQWGEYAEQSHIFDIDELWNQVQSLAQENDGLKKQVEEQENTLTSYKQENEQSNRVLKEETFKKIKTAYYLGGAAILLAIIQFILFAVGVL